MITREKERSKLMCYLLCAFTLFLSLHVLRAADLTGILGDSYGSDDEDSILAELGEKKVLDYELLGNSCRIDIRHWTGVRQPVRRGKKPEAGPFGWEYTNRKGHAVTPVPGSTRPATVRLAVPVAGAYRIWLRERLQTERPSPVELVLSGSSRATHVFGAKALKPTPSKQLEKTRCLHFEDEAIRETFPTGPTWLWEYWDVDLDKGVLDLALLAQQRNVFVTTLFITQSKSFVPNLSQRPANNTLEHMYYRFRIVDAKQRQLEINIPGQSMTYHRPFCPRGAKQGFYYSYISRNSVNARASSLPITGSGGNRTFTTGTWSDWVDVSWSSAASSRWATVKLGIKGVRDGVADVQVAWFPHENAVAKTVTAVIKQGIAVYLMPLSSEVCPPVNFDCKEKTPVWGMVRASYLSRLQTAGDVHRRQLKWVDEIIAGMGLPANHPMPKKVGLFTNCDAAPGAYDMAMKMLARMGIGEIWGRPGKIKTKYDMNYRGRLLLMDWGYLSRTHDPCDPSVYTTALRELNGRAKRGEQNLPDYRALVNVLALGDEIGPIVRLPKISASAWCRQHFHNYLRLVLKEKGVGPEFFGVHDITDLYPGCNNVGPDISSGIFGRRLHYYRLLHRHVLTADYYRKITQAGREVFPGVETYTNFSPHPIVLDMQTMEFSNWFSLPRKQGVTTAWGEDWFWGSKLGGLEMVSFYTAWVECAARAHKASSGFYSVANCGNADHKIFSMLGRNIKHPMIYAYGPRYAGAEGSNFWSENKGAYAAILRATCAIGPADEIIAEGTPETRRVALLYNRTHEIMSGGRYGVLADRLFTFTALANAHRNADIILVEDLVPDKLRQYRVVYLNGFNLPAAAVAPLHEWVEAGGVLVCAAGTGMKDEYGTPSQAMTELLGARQLYVATSKGNWVVKNLRYHKPIGTLNLHESPLTPALTADVTGSRVRLTPTTGTCIGTWENGTCAATLRTVGRGRVLLFGFMPGILYKGALKGDSRYRDERIRLVTKPAVMALPNPPVATNAKQIEVSRFDHPTGIAVMLNNFRCWEQHKTQPDIRLTVLTDRDINSVRGSLSGDLEWKRIGKRIEVVMPLPRDVDVVILR